MVAKRPLSLGKGHQLVSAASQQADQASCSGAKHLELKSTPLCHPQRSRQHSLVGWGADDHLVNQHPIGDIREAGVTQLQLSQDAAEGKSAPGKELGGRARFLPYHRLPRLMTPQCRTSLASLQGARQKQPAANPSSTQTPEDRSPTFCQGELETSARQWSAGHSC